MHGAAEGRDNVIAVLVVLGRPLLLLLLLEGRRGRCAQALPPSHQLPSEAKKEIIWGP